MSNPAPAVPQTRLPGQAAAPPGPVDLMPMYVMHHGFRRDLRLFGSAVAATPVDDRATWRELAARWQRFARILHHHHRGEDELLWPLLLERVDAAGDAAGRTTLEEMEAEHEEIDPLLAGCAAGFARLCDAADSDARAALAVRLAATNERLGQHLGHEESQAMVLVQAHVTVAEWAAMDRAFGKHYTVADALFAVPWVLDGLPDHDRRAMLRFLGPVISVAWRFGLRRRYHHGQQRILGAVDGFGTNGQQT